MAKFLDNWVPALGLAALICVGCKQSNPKTIAEDIADFSQMNFAEVKAAADKGSPVAQFELGERFYYGKGILKDSTEAVEWWQKAAAQKFPPAEYELGVAYGRGDGVPKDAEQGIKWCRMAADAGLPVAQEFIGALYALPQSSLKQDYVQAFKWLKASADQGYPHAEYLLALCYRDGKGTETNLTESIFWLQRAASNGVVNAQVRLGRYYSDKALRQINSNSPPSYLRTNSNFLLCVGWFEKAANQGDTGGQIFFGTAYATGCGIDKNPVEAYKWLTLASAKDSNSITTLINDWKTDNVIIFTSAQIAAGKQRAEEFSKTNQITQISVQEIPGL